jgi:putative aldouronate transport system substrate-binding protein
MLPPKANEDGGRLSAGAPSIGYTSYRKANSSRIAELLAITDLAAAPFGSETWQFLNYGVLGTDSTTTPTGPKLNDRGNSELNCNVRYLGSGPAVNYIAGNQNQTRLRHSYQVKTVPNLIKNPAEGLYSQTQGSKGAQLSTLITNAVNDVVLGRKPLSSWSETVKTWRSSGGDAMRKELEKAFAQRSKG